MAINEDYERFRSRRQNADRLQAIMIYITIHIIILTGHFALGSKTTKAIENGDWLYLFGFFGLMITANIAYLRTVYSKPGRVIIDENLTIYHKKVLTVPNNNNDNNDNNTIGIDVNNRDVNNNNNNNENISEETNNFNNNNTDMNNINNNNNNNSDNNNLNDIEDDEDDIVDDETRLINNNDNINNNELSDVNNSDILVDIESIKSPNVLCKDITKGVVAMQSGYASQPTPIASITETIESVHHEVDPRDREDYCWDCSLIMPPRSKHCEFCGFCVTKYDHHCPFVSNCVGGENHHKFWLFLFLQSIMLIWGFLISVTTFEDSSSDDHPLIWLLKIGLTFFNLMVGFLVISLFCFHTYLAVIGQTTLEMVRQQRSAYRRRHRIVTSRYDVIDPSQYDEGIFKNILTFCSGKLHDKWKIGKRVIIVNQEQQQ